MEGGGFANPAESRAKSFPFRGGKRSATWYSEVPSAKEERQPGWIQEVVGAVSVGIPFLAVHQVEPRTDFAMTVFYEFGVGRMHLMT